MKSVKNQKVITENQVREIVRKGLKEGLLTEIGYDADHSMGGLVDAWRPFFDALSISGQVILSNVLTQLRLFTTFNHRKAQQIADRQKDRNANFRQQLDAIDMPVGPDVWMPLAMFAPGPFIAATLADKGAAAAEGSIEWLKGAGVGDWAIDELEPGGAVAKRKREEEESGPVAKLLRSLEDIFLLRMGAEDQGNLLAEARGSVGENLTSELMGGEYGSMLKSMQNEFLQDIETAAREVEKAQAQIDFLKNVTQIDSLDSLQTEISNLQQMQPDADLGDIQSLPAQLKKDTEEMMKNEEQREEAVKTLLQSAGNEEPTEEEIANVPEEEIKKHFENIAFESAVDGFKQGASQQIASIQKIYNDLYEELFPPQKGAAAEAMNASAYGEAARMFKSKIDALG
tara:strand:+ start:3222 stop:4421 length:1200 start_codon:yes stop_codon:yes gene_type:complete